jgi:hypothetical protein
MPLPARLLGQSKMSSCLLGYRNNVEAIGRFFVTIDILITYENVSIRAKETMSE